MPIATSQAPSTVSSSPKLPELGIEPDEQWKTNLRTRIEEGLQSVVQDAKDHLAAELRRAPVGVEERERLTAEYSDTMATIRKLAAEGFQTELGRERQERRWASGQAVLPQWSQALKEEQQDIMDRIKVSFSAKPPAPPGDVRPPAAVPKPTPREIPPSVSYPVPEFPAELQKEREDKERREGEQERESERERERERKHDRTLFPVHSGLDTYRSKYSQTFRHATHNLLPEMMYSEPVLDNGFTDEPEELLRPLERYRGLVDGPPIHDRPIEASVSRSMERQTRSVSDRHSAHSPLKPIPEVWKPAITPEDDARMSKPFPLGGRGSTASIMSTGSGGVRPSIQALKEEQQDIMDRIKVSFSAKPPAPPGDARLPATVPKPTPREIPPSVSYPIPELQAELQKEREDKERRERERETERERERERGRAPFSVPSVRRGSDTYGSEYSQTFRLATYNLVPERLYSEPVLDNEYTNEPEELLRPPERHRGLAERPPGHDRPTEAPVSRSMEHQTRSVTVSDRHSVHSPPKPTPEVWKPAITPEDDARMSKPFPLGSRGSTASIRTTGSGWVRPSIVEAIPERADDMMEISERRERERVQDVEREWAPIDKAHERERQIPARNEGRPSVAGDHSQRYDDPVAYGITSVRPPDHHERSYDPHPRPVRHQASFRGLSRHHYREKRRGGDPRWKEEEPRRDTAETTRQDEDDAESEAEINEESEADADAQIQTQFRVDAEAEAEAKKREAEVAKKEETRREEEEMRREEEAKRKDEARRKAEETEFQGYRDATYHNHPNLPSSSGAGWEKVDVTKASGAARKGARWQEQRVEAARWTQTALEKMEKDGDSEDEKYRRSSPLPKGKQGERIETEEEQNYSWSQPLIVKFKQIFQSKHQYQHFLSRRGSQGQKLLDLLQLIMNLPDLDDQFRNEALAAMQRLSKSSRLYPTCFDLKDAVQLDGEGPVAAGAFADIHKGYFQDQLVCLKSIRVYQKSKVNYIVKQVSREAILWSRLSHPNLLPFYGVYRDKLKRACLVSPWIDNGHVQEYLESNPNAGRARLSLDVAAGIAYLHEMGIVHGDLKGPNILVSSSGRACLADFGLSGVIDHHILNWTSQSSPASAGGSVRWQAPELLAPEDTGTDSKIRNSKMSDVYAWSCVCYEIFTSRNPFFEEARNTTVTLKIMRGDNPSCPPPASPPRRLWGLTQPIWNMMSECWSYDPAKRPSIDDIVARLAHTQEASPDARPPQNWGHVPTWHFRDAVNRPHEYPSIEDLDSILSF